MTPDAFSAVQHPVVGSGLHAYVPYSFEVTDIAATGSACFIASRPVGAGMQGYRDTLVFGAGLSASWAEVARPRDIEEQYDCSGALKIHLRLAGESAITDGREPVHAIGAGSCSALLQPCGARKIEVFRASDRERSVTVSCTRDYLLHELGLDAERYGGALARYLAGGPDPFALFHASLSLGLRQAAQSFFETMDDRVQRRLRLQSSTQDVLRHFFALMREADEAVCPPRPRDQAIAERVARRLADALREPPSLQELADQSGVSVSKLARTFKAVQGVTLSEYLLAARMRHAMALIRQARLPVTQVALEVGYDHAGNFSTAFRRHYGMSPRDAARG